MAIMNLPHAEKENPPSIGLIKRMLGLSQRPPILAISIFKAVSFYFLQSIAPRVFGSHNNKGVGRAYLESLNFQFSSFISMNIM
jgi:hypothetical protein